MFVFGVVGGEFGDFSVGCFSVCSLGFVKGKGVWCGVSVNHLCFRVLLSRV